MYNIKQKNMKIFIICLILVALMIGTLTTYAVWQEQLFRTENPQNSSGNWIESQKYIIFSEITEGSTIIGYAVKDYQGLIDTVEIPRVHLGKPVTTIKGAFVNNTLVREIIIPDTVLIIESYAFLNFTRLQKVTVRGGEKTLTIGDYAFMNCSSLSTFNIDVDRVLSISTTSFFNTNGITKPVVSG